jgi:hypothetical protein
VSLLGGLDLACAADVALIQIKSMGQVPELAHLVECGLEFSARSPLEHPPGRAIDAAW